MFISIVCGLSGIPESLETEFTKIRFISYSPIRTISQVYSVHFGPQVPRGYQMAWMLQSVTRPCTFHYQKSAAATSIFRTGRTGKWVVTHLSARPDFHGNRLAAKFDQHLFTVLIRGLFKYAFGAELGLLNWKVRPGWLNWKTTEDNQRRICTTVVHILWMTELKDGRERPTTTGFKSITADA